MRQTFPAEEQEEEKQINKLSHLQIRISTDIYDRKSKMLFTVILKRLMDTTLKFTYTRTLYI